MANDPGSFRSLRTARSLARWTWRSTATGASRIADIWATPVRCDRGPDRLGPDADGGGSRSRILAASTSPARTARAKTASATARTSPGSSAVRERRGAVRGVAPGVNFVSLRVLDDNGEGHVSDVIAAIDWAIEHRRSSTSASSTSRWVTRGRVVPHRPADPRRRARLVRRPDGHRLRRQPRPRRPHHDQLARQQPLRADRRRHERPEHRGPRRRHHHHLQQPRTVLRRLRAQAGRRGAGNRIVSQLAPGADVADLHPESVVGTTASSCPAPAWRPASSPVSPRSSPSRTRS